jgi:hypothetical protein
MHTLWLERRFWNRTFENNEKGKNLERDVALMRQLLDEDETESETES